MTKNLNKVIAIVGPTASGKTAYAIDLAKNIGGEIVSADSRLVYKGFNIGTAKPTIEEKMGIPHYMIDIVEPEDEYSAGRYVKDAEIVIEDIISRGKIPIITGGTGLYINMLLMDYNMPNAAPDYELRQELKKLENPYEMLCELDESYAKNIDKNDKKKIIRAIEIIKVSGKLPERNIEPSKKYDVEWIGLNFPREELYRRINLRVDKMIEDGLIEETKELLKKHGRINNILYTIGYQEMTAYLDGVLTLDDAVDKLKQNTRRYAKRQLTWFRKNSDIKWNFYPEKLKK